MTDNENNKEVDNAQEDVDEMFNLLNLKKKKKKKKTEEDEHKQDENKENDDDYLYTDLLDKIYSRLKPTKSLSQKVAIPAPKIIKHGTKKTMWVNSAEICSVLRRDIDHVFLFFLSELSCLGSIDASQHIIFGGVFRQDHIQSVLKKYIVDYVSCGSCKKTDTILNKDPVLRLQFKVCNLCGSKVSVDNIKQGFRCTTKADRKQARL